MLYFHIYKLNSIDKQNTQVLKSWGGGMTGRVETDGYTCGNGIQICNSRRKLLHFTFIILYVEQACNLDFRIEFTTARCSALQSTAAKQKRPTGVYF